MKMNRRNVLLGLGTVVAGGGAALGTGAFSSVEANRTVSIQVAEDDSAFLSLTPSADSDFVDTDGDGAIRFNLQQFDNGINVNSDLTIEDAFSIGNESGQNLDVELDVTDDDESDVSIAFDPGPSYEIDDGESEDDIDMTISTGSEDGTFNITLTVIVTERST
ncbi:hypothetical protein [Natronoglomus mannanivorans]|uniref:Uncharacterized protein n=1 Tax=Natronoglomus mannanivorans TaxID=2979990 RepID=A0AAP2Z2U5_9EURY|nr:hypothetical protein [Halobacteria archaeon AArc-xg1-1]